MAEEETTTTETQEKETAETGGAKPDQAQLGLQADLARERRQAKAAQAELDRLRAELKKRDDADLSETEKLRKQLAEAETARETLMRNHQTERTRHAIEREAGRMRFADPADAWQLIDQTRIDYDTNGVPTNLGQLLDELAKTKPYLTARPGNGSGEGGPRGGAAAGFSMDDWLRRAAGRK